MIFCWAANQRLATWFFKKNYCHTSRRLRKSHFISLGVICAHISSHFSQTSTSCPLIGQRAWIGNICGHWFDYSTDVQSTVHLWWDCKIFNCRFSSKSNQILRSIIKFVTLSPALAVLSSNKTRVGHGQLWSVQYLIDFPMEEAKPSNSF